MQHTGRFSREEHMSRDAVKSPLEYSGRAVPRMRTGTVP
jgi:hypothetical protein